MTSGIRRRRTDVVNVDGLLRLQARERGDSTAIVEGSSRLTWAGLDRQVEGLSRGFSELGLVAGHRVAIASANRTELVACYLAALRGGLVAVPVNPTSRPGEVQRVLADSGARVCVSDHTALAAVREARAGGEAQTLVVAIDTDATGTGRALAGEVAYGDLPSEGARTVSPRDPESLAVLLYTSGTSGRPRAAMLSHRALLANIEQSAATNPPPVRPDDIVLGVLPMFHVYGLNAVLGQVLLTGATLVLGDRFDPSETLALIERERVTCVPIAPPVITAWLGVPGVADRLSSVTTLISGAAPMPGEAVRSFEALTGISVEQGYGLTEAAPVVTSTIGSSTHKPGSSGRAVPGVELRIVDDAGDDVVGVDGSDPGEIWVRGRNLFSGYWPDGDSAPGQEGWLHTGDIGFLDADGDLFMVDRLKELVIVSGFNVYPSEIEDVISEVPGVAECAVIGVARAATGEAVLAYVVPTPNLATDDETLSAAVLAHCADRLARFKLPSRVEVVEELPHSATGKVAKGRLRAGQARHEMGLS